MWGPKSRQQRRPSVCLLTLPDAVLIQILQYLPNVDLHCRVALVCKKMLAFSREPALNHTLCLYGKADPLKVKVHLARHWPTVQHLQLEMAAHCVQGLNVKLLKTADDFCPRLEVLTLLGFPATYPNGLFELAHGLTFSYLSELHLQCGPWDKDFVKDVIDNRPSILQSLVISGGSSQNRRQKMASDLYPHLGQCLELRRLHLAEVVTPTFWFSLGRLSHLRELVLSNLSGTLLQRDFHQLFLHVQWRQMQKLVLQPCREFDKDCWSALWKVAEQLEWLQLQGCKQLTLTGLPPRHGGHLKTLVLLDMPSLSHEDVQLGLTHYPQLEYLEMSGFPLSPTATLAPLLAQHPLVLAVFNNHAYFHPHMPAKALAKTCFKHKELLHVKDLSPL